MSETSYIVKEVVQEDPHKEQDVYWKIDKNGDLFQKCSGQANWNKVKRVHITPARAKMFFEMYRDLGHYVK